MRSGGSQANLSGNSLEKFVENALIENGYSNSEQDAKHYIKQHNCGKTIYGTNRKCDFFVHNIDKFPKGLVIECKWQQTLGSVRGSTPNNPGKSTKPLTKLNSKLNLA